jgi:hypothetical protein
VTAEQSFNDSWQHRIPHPRFARIRLAKDQETVTALFDRHTKQTMAYLT